MKHHKDPRIISIDHYGLPLYETSPEQMALLAGDAFALSDRVPEAVGEAFDFIRWYYAWRSLQGIGEKTPEPTHLKVEGNDSFEALIPWEQLAGSAIQFAIDGKPLHKGGPIRLYVPNGSSACLNVKSVAACRFLHDEASRGDVSYGFKNAFSPQDLRQNTTK
ncbi:hypothetical protein [Paenibacillus nasutitermitis]|uniref:Uncharacterized protein n=1 Tax=Paenibacillus nasutitermitis TaxID=1652958 RepID=A0A916Z4P7_9BACL|nr:hypothetical protein [Paenibacillus nasutitermitis]GGD74342.1 hypothetical protein GCM10010911_35300 [Paenibacillus nasutitermitis]